MKKSAAAVAAAVAVLAMAALSGVALAGDHHGDHGPQKSSSDSQAGVKPSNTTDKNTSCTTGGGQGSSATCQSDTSSKSDASKRYGNGKTAAQIANGKGAPAGTTITGPGNSQPHKICGRDVHAYKGGNCQSKPPEQSQQMVTFCDMSSATTGDLETKPADQIAKHEFDGNPEENRDIVPPFTLDGKTYSENWPSGEAIFNAGCNLAPPPVTTTTTQATTTVKACDDESAESGDEQGESKDDHGKGDDEHRKAGDVHGKPAGDDAKPDDDKAKSDDDCNGVESTTTAAATTTAATTTAATTTEATTTVATTTTTAAAAAVTPPPASGVLGASKALTAPASTPASAPAGVLGTLKTLGTSATTGTLPFTGLRLWIVALIALGLIGTGVAMRMLARRGA